MFCVRRFYEWLVIESEAPKRNDDAMTILYVIAHDNSIRNIFYLLLALLFSSNLKSVVINLEV